MVGLSASWTLNTSPTLSAIPCSLKLDSDFDTSFSYSNSSSISSSILSNFISTFSVGQETFELDFFFSETFFLKGGSSPKSFEKSASTFCFNFKAS